MEEIENTMDKATTYLHLVLECVFRAGFWIFVSWIDSRSPYVRHIDEDELWYYRYPSVDSFVPKPYMYALIVLTPIIVFFLQYVTMRESRHTIPSIISHTYGITLAYCLCKLYVSLLKITVGRPRPNFYLRCFPEGYGTDIDMCDGEYHGQMDGRKSFPSSHAALAFCCVTYLVRHINRIMDLQKPRFLKGIIITGLFLMILVATEVGVSRTMDYHNNYSDVVFGGLIGVSIGYACHHLYDNRDELLETNIRKLMRLEVSRGDLNVEEIEENSL